MASAKRVRNEVTEIYPVAPDVEPPIPRQMKRCIVRIDLPAGSSTDPHAPALLYNEDKSVLQVVTATGALRARFRPGEYSAYFFAGISQDDVEIGERAPAPWGRNG